MGVKQQALVDLFGGQLHVVPRPHKAFQLLEGNVLLSMFRKMAPGSIGRPRQSMRPTRLTRWRRVDNEDRRTTTEASEDTRSNGTQNKQEPERPLAPAALTWVETPGKNSNGLWHHPCQGSQGCIKIRDDLTLCFQN